ncbi:MAG: hypothetical protein VYC99_08895 [Pseudomonadota bacterium]|nr:hypothetical protein [Pseudomonadota bacterium]
MSLPIIMVGGGMCHTKPGIKSFAAPGGLPGSHTVDVLPHRTSS